MTPLPLPVLDRRFVTIDDPRWRQAHGSTVLPVITADGRVRVLAAWFAGEREGAADSRIWGSSWEPGDGGWRAPVALSDDGDPRWNPVLAQGPDGEVWLFSKSGARISEWTTLVRRSGDGGRTWGPEHPLVSGDRGGRGPVRNPPLLLADGTWLAPASLEVWEPTPRWDSFVDRSEDGGVTWTPAPIPLDRSALTGAGVIQPTLWVDPHDPTIVRALLRSSEGVAYTSSSADAGRSWTPAVPTPLPNNNSGLAALAVAGDDVTPGGVLLAHNPTSGDWAARCPLVLSWSDGDPSGPWREVAVLDDGRTPVDADPAHLPQTPEPDAFAPADGGVLTDGRGEYSYPALTLEATTVHVTWTWQRRGIVHAAVPLSDLGLQAPRTVTHPYPDPKDLP